MAVLTVEMARQGLITIPNVLCEQYKWDVGQQFVVIDLDGVVIMSPRESRVDVLGDQLRDDLLQGGATPEDMLTELRRIRDT